MRSQAPTALVVGLLALVVAVLFGDSLFRPFFGDDFLFLEKARDAAPLSLWSFDQLAYHFYRPWSRELHFWALQGLFGLRELPFHLSSLVLWLAVLSLYFVWVRRHLGASVAAIAVAGVATIEAWAVPVPWSSGSQDLWMLLWALACLNAFARGHRMLATIALGLALLSKEAAATLPAIVLLYVWTVERRPLSQALKATAPLWILLLVWAALHPMLGGRSWRPEAQLAFLAFKPLEVAVGSLLTTINLERLPHPALGWPKALAAGLPAALVLALLLLVVRDPSSPGASSGGRTARFAAGWALLAWLPTLMPVVAWQPYYALHGALGAWMIIAQGLARYRGAAVAAIVALALLRATRLDTRSGSWASGWSQRFGAHFIGETREFLTRRHPDLPPHSRLFFAAVPRGVALVSGPGDAPPLRVWYRDRTIEGSFYSRYRPRSLGWPPGPDLFFRHDSLSGWVEVVRGEEDVAAARQANPRWERDHEVLAKTLAGADDWVNAAREYAKLAAADPGRLEYAFNAAVSYESLGDSAAAAEWYRRAASLPDADDEVRADARRLARHLRAPTMSR